MKNILRKECFNLKKSSKLPYSLVLPFYDKVREKEVSHSEIIRELLDPNGKHQHKSEFIDLFLNDISLKFNHSDISDIDIVTERSSKVSDSSTSRPIDILITYKRDKNPKYKRAIIIENKLNYAVDQANQINDYYDGIKREGYEIDRIVYMHINPEKTIATTDTQLKLQEITSNYDASKLILTLNKMKTYSYINEYINLLENISHSYMSTNNATKIQNELTNEELSKIIEVSSLVNSNSWNEAKHKKVIENLKLSHLKDSFKQKYSEFYFDNYKLWIELWYYPTTFELYIGSYDEVDQLQVKDSSYVKWGAQGNRYLYENLKKKKFDYPSHTDYDDMIKEIADILENSIK